MSSPQNAAGNSAPPATSTAPITAPQTQYDLAFQVAPIILQGGIATGVQGSLLPITSLYGQSSLVATATSVDQFFARYLPLSGSTLISTTVGTYSFANQQVAANAIVIQPLTLSMLMIAPVNQPGGYLTKLATFTALQTSLLAHISAGGLFSIATPAFVYNNLLMTGMTDVTHGESNQQQIEWQLDFVQPILTVQQAMAAQQALLARVTGGGKITGQPSWSGSLQAASNAAAGLTGALVTFGGSSSSLVQSAINQSFGSE